MSSHDPRDRAGAPPRALGVARLFGALVLGGFVAALAVPPAVEATGAIEFFRADSRATQPGRAEPPGLLGRIFGGERRAAPRVRPAPQPRQATPRPAAEPRQARRIVPSSRGRTYCVRMCDGYYFPVGDLAARRDLPLHDLACNAGCPGAPTKLFVLPPGAEEIEEAKAADGMRYADLPMAQAYTTAIDGTCSCQGPNRRVADRLDIRHDMTLRRGDIVVTREGPLVYRGRDGQPEELAEFRPFGEAEIAGSLRAKADARLGVSFRKEIAREFLAETRATVDMASR
ncbi:DUF2865 domain-containing protein [Salinarimonas sp.]|uniref:DUF2865 domain-containing protein n=1 Tax=Salinarimonas sp. TaxID=2766526 RepID=UPI0032D98134